VIAHVIAMVLGTTVAYAVHSFRFFAGVDLVLPHPAAGAARHHTGIALARSSPLTASRLSIVTIVIGHPLLHRVFTQRHRQRAAFPGRWPEASMDSVPAAGRRCAS